MVSVCHGHAARPHLHKTLQPCQEPHTLFTLLQPAPASTIHLLSSLMGNASCHQEAT